MTTRPLIIDAMRTAWRSHIPTAVVLTCALGLLAAGYARSIALGMPVQAALDVLASTQWLAINIAAIALGAHVACPNSVDALLIARGMRPGVVWGARFAGAAAVLAGMCAMSAAVLAAAAALGWVVASSSLIWLPLGLACEAIVVMSLSATLRLWLPPAWTWSVAASLWWLGHLADETLALAAEGRAWAPWLYSVVPDLDRFDGAVFAAQSTHPSPTVVALTLTSAALWTLACTAAALWTVQR